MILEEIRPSFTVYLIGADGVQALGDTLELAGYVTASYAEVDEALGDVAHNPPHVVLFEAGATPLEALVDVVARAHELLPETHVIPIATHARRAEVVGLLDAGAYDILYWPPTAPIEVLRAVDRAAERDYYMYLNERAQADVAQASPAVALVDPNSGAAADFARDVFRCRTVDECVALFLDRVGGGVYFRYVANRRVLLATAKAHVDVEIGGVGLDLNDATAGFQSQRLREPRALLKDLVAEVFGTSDFFTRTLEVGGDVQGVFVFTGRLDEDPSLDDHLLLVDRAIGLLEMEKRLHVVNVRDPQTDVLARPHFITRTTQEVSRARRVNLPVSLLILSFDQYDLVGTEAGKDEADLMLRTIARLCERHSRVHDVIGRLGPSELGVLLPHTGRRGALIKAERLRRALGQADFSKVVRTHPRVTVSVGVSEYPTLTRDAEDLVTSADETLFHIRRRGDRVAVAEAPSGFTPDFPVTEKGP